jgi:hypothetical protein
MDDNADGFSGPFLIPLRDEIVSFSCFNYPKELVIIP